MGISIKEAQDRSGWIFLGTDAPLAWTLMWLHSSMPLILRGKSVFAPYLTPNQKNLKYMVETGKIQVAKSPTPDGAEP